MCSTSIFIKKFSHLDMQSHQMIAKIEWLNAVRK